MYKLCHGPRTKLVKYSFYWLPANSYLLSSEFKTPLFIWIRVEKHPSRCVYFGNIRKTENFFTITGRLMAIYTGLHVLKNQQGLSMKLSRPIFPVLC